MFFSCLQVKLVGLPSSIVEGGPKWTTVVNPLRLTPILTHSKSYGCGHKSGLILEFTYLKLDSQIIFHIELFLFVKNLNYIFIKNIEVLSLKIQSVYFVQAIYFLNFSFFNEIV